MEHTIKERPISDSDDGPSVRRSIVSGCIATAVCAIFVSSAAIGAHDQTVHTDRAKTERMQSIKSGPSPKRTSDKAELSDTERSLKAEENQAASAKVQADAANSQATSATKQTEAAQKTVNCTIGLLILAAIQLIILVWQTRQAQSEAREVRAASDKERAESSMPVLSMQVNHGPVVGGSTHIIVQFKNYGNSVALDAQVKMHSLSNAVRIETDALYADSIIVPRSFADANIPDVRLPLVVHPSVTPQESEAPLEHDLVVIVKYTNTHGILFSTSRRITLTVDHRGMVLNSKYPDRFHRVTYHKERVAIMEPGLSHDVINADWKPSSP